MKKRIFWAIRLSRLLTLVCAALLLGGGLTTFFVIATQPTALQKAVDLNHQPVIAIVIDDFGQDRGGVKEMLALPLPLTCAVMPNMEYTLADAQAAFASGKEVIVHMPMQAHPGDPMSWYGPEPILLRHSYEEARAIAERAVKAVPHAIGMNIHIGSESSEKDTIVSGVMEVCKDADFYFLDSLTSQKSVCERVAGECEVPFLVRHVFLENGNRAKSHVVKKLKEAVKIAQSRGSCVVIGHVGPEGGKNTAAAIAELIPYFEQQGVQIVPASQLLELDENLPSAKSTATAKPL